MDDGTKTALKTTGIVALIAAIGYGIYMFITNQQASAATAATIASDAITSSASSTNAAIGVQMNDIVITLGSAYTGVTISGLPEGVYGNFSSSNDIFTISGTPSLAGVFNYTITATGAGSLSNTLSGNITVTEPLNLTDDTASGDTTQELTANNPIEKIIFDTEYDATGVTSVGLPTGVTAVYSNGKITISGTPTTAGSFPYTVTSTGGAENQTASGTIDVNPSATTANTTVEAFFGNATFSATYIGGGNSTFTSLINSDDEVTFGLYSGDLPIGTNGQTIYDYVVSNVGTSMKYNGANQPCVMAIFPNNDMYSSNIYPMNLYTANLIGLPNSAVSGLTVFAPSFVNQYVIQTVQYPSGWLSLTPYSKVPSSMPTSGNVVLS